LEVRLVDSLRVQRIRLLWVRFQHHRLPHQHQIASWVFVSAMELPKS
jgi:hypothetical protein